jgi:hypothetical protein
MPYLKHRFQRNSATLTWKPEKTATQIILTGGDKVLSTFGNALMNSSGRSHSVWIERRYRLFCQMRKDDKIRGTATLQHKRFFSWNTVVVHPKRIWLCYSGCSIGSRIVLVASDSAGNEFLKVPPVNRYSEKYQYKRGFEKNKPIFTLQFRNCGKCFSYC